VTLPAELRFEAKVDVVSARDWYNGQRPGLGDEFVATVDELISQIEQTPELYAVVVRDVRRVKVRRFPYVAYYRILENRIEILAVLHGRRNPKIWRGRI
jgi:plasmid stabilization system protein ParE